MKKITLFCILLLPILVFGQSQNYIKILGMSTLTMEASSVNLNITLTEIKRDEYQKIRERSIDEIKEELSTYLKRVGCSLDDLEDIWPPKSSYNKTLTESYILKVKTVEEAKEIFKFPIKGYKASNFEYVFPEVYEYDEMELSTTALKDAKRKADALAAHIGKKVGEIISIEDMANGSIKPSRNKNNPTSTYKYNLIVSYELLD